jgi:hypothetical protein
MKWMLALILLVLISQIGLFLYGRKIKRQQNLGVIEKYNLRTPKDAWEALANPEITDEDKTEIKRLYEGEN